MQDESVNVFLKEQNITLFEGEKILDLIWTKKPATSTFPAKHINVLLALSLITSFFFFLVNPAIVALIIGLIWIVGISSQVSFYNRKLEVFGLITSEGIRTEKKALTGWEKIYHIDRYEDKHENTTFLTFHLIKNPKNRNAILQSKHAFYQTKRYIYWAGNYGNMYINLFPYWEAKDPLQTPLRPICNHLENTYQLKEISGSEKRVEYQTKQNHFTFSCSYNRRLPFTQLNASITLHNPVTAHLLIKSENTPKRKHYIGLNDILIGNPIIDEHYLFEGSHETELQELFTDEVIGLFKRLSKLGTANWSFGKPLKKKRLQAPKSSIQDTEDVLDTSLLKRETPDTVYKITDKKTYNELEFNGILSPNFKEDANKAAEFVELGMELSVLFANGLREIKK